MSELRDALRVESILVEQAFSEHMDLALGVFLTDPEVYYSHLEELRKADKTGPSAPLVRRLGLWPVRHAIENLDALDVDLAKVPEDQDDEEYEYLPQFTDRDVQLRIEAFGLAMLDEAFLCLGEDALEQVKRYKAARSRKRRREGIDWLATRLNDIKLAAKKPGDEEDEATPEGTSPYLYHPAELSPKFIGRWPDIRIRPTCLALSILAASFYHTAGDKMVHAGVVRTAKEDSQAVMAAIIRIATEAAEGKGIELTDRFEEFRLQYSERLQETLESDPGFHAVTLSHYHGDTWMQTDPNYELNVFMQPRISQKIEGVHDLLREIEPNAKGLERILINRNAMTHWYFMHFGEHLVRNMPSADLMEEYLLGLPDDVALSDIVNFLLYEFHDPNVNGHHFPVKDQLTRLAKYVYNASYEEYVTYKGAEMMLGHVFAEARSEDISKCLARCKYDARYRRDRANDMVMFPFYALINMGVDYTNESGGNTFKRAHAVYEIGLPEYRIGAAALSDLASMLGSNLPPSFWLTYWPSHIALAEHAQGYNFSPSQNALIGQVAEYIDYPGWTYYPVHGILNNVLEQGG